MNRAPLLALGLLVTAAASAAPPYPPRSYRPPVEVVVERDRAAIQLAQLNNELTEAIGRAGPNRELAGRLQRIRAHVDALRDELMSAPVFEDDSMPNPGWNNPPPPARPPMPAPPMGPQPMRPAELDNLCVSIDRADFAKDKLSVIQMAAAQNYFTVGQVRRILSRFTFSSDKLQAVRVLRNRILDRNNAFQLQDAFDFDSEREQLRQMMQ